MSEPKKQALQVPPEIARYIQGATPATRQFEFLLGEWDVAATRYKEDGSVLFRYRATWSARYLNEGRMMVDDFKALDSAGQAVSSYVTLRTYSEATRRWEMAGLAALQPSATAEWHGEWKGGEMLLDARGRDPAGNGVMTKIRFFDIETNSFNWESETSRDEGKTWVKAASLHASRAPR